MKCEIKKVGDVTVVALNGEIAFSDMKYLRELILAEIAQPSTHKVIIDLGGAVMIDSSVVGFMVSVYKTVTANKGAFAVSRPNDLVRRLLLTLGLTRMFQIFETQDEAMKTMSNPMPLEKTAHVPAMG